MLADRARDAREVADATGNPADIALADALEAALAAECRELLSDVGTDRSTDGIPTAGEAGFVTEVKIPPGEGAN